ncbi:hypothetical protein [Actinomadura latina]|uniref:Uncharacterized protein n=1 Tax=Actinomadura latina TaxID=163603 RepID=A0A846YS27_9ACTN|nr:hypothetical protein [Actinomadura latina]NKZ03129.1 hypothetical protein [Actinomadura latina]
MVVQELIAAAVVACVGLLATHGLWLAAALLSERNQRWRYGCTSEEDKELRERILTFDPYTEMARVRRGVSDARTAAGDGTRGAGEAKRRGDKDGRRRP